MSIAPRNPRLGVGQQARISNAPVDLIDQYLERETQDILSTYLAPGFSFPQDESEAVTHLVQNAGIKFNRQAIGEYLEAGPRSQKGWNSFMKRIGQTGLKPAIVVERHRNITWVSFLPEKLSPRPFSEAERHRHVGIQIRPMPFFDRRKGACRGSGNDLYFIRRGGGAVTDVAAAKESCQNCKLKQPCLEFAVMTNQEFGVWGGTTENERRVLRKEWRQSAEEVA